MQTVDIPLRTGTRVVLRDDCPIESEGVGPLPGETGELLSPPSGHDRRRCWTVRFEAHGGAWSIPEQYLAVAERPH